MKRPVIITLCLFLLTFAEGSREQDSLALVAMQEANPECTLDWDYSTPLDDWAGVNLGEGRVIHLNLDNTGILVLPKDIGNLTNLERLFLYKNSISSLPNEVLKLKKLTYLSMVDNQLNKVPEVIYEITTLCSLDLEENNIDMISSNISSLENLKHLNLNMNNIVDFPNEIIELKSMDYFLFYDNFLDERFLSFNTCNWLESFASDWHVDQKEIETDFIKIKEQLYELKKFNPKGTLDWSVLEPLSEWDNIVFDDSLNDVTRLNLKNKNLTLLTEGISHLQNLEIIDISKNYVDFLPENISMLQNIKELDLSHNDLDYLPTGILSLKPENKFDISYNNLIEKELPQEFIDWLDTYDPDWRDTQGLESVISTSKAVDHTPKMNAMKNTLSFSGTLTIDSRITIVSPNGRVIFESALQNSSIDIPTLSKGFYLVSLESQDKTYRFKFVR